MARLKGFPDTTYIAMQHIRDTTLSRFDSLFGPETALWSRDNLQRFHDLFVPRFEQGEGSFFEKWRTQLQGATDDIFQLAAELLYVQQFFTSLTGPEKKIENVQEVLSWRATPVVIPEWAKSGVSAGLAGDQSFNQQRQYHLAWLLQYFIHWHDVPQHSRDELLGDPWRFAADVRGVPSPLGAHQPMQEAWLYLIFPETFENISSRRDKLRIRDAFYERLGHGPTANIDADLLEIRKSLTNEAGAGFQFYRSPIVERWKQPSFTRHDLEQIRQSRMRDRYTDFSLEEKAAYKRVHEALQRLGKLALDELGGGRDYVVKLTAGFHPNSGIRGGKPKDLWFGIYRKENEDQFLGNPQVFMIVSARGVEWGFAPLTHPDDFSNQDIRRKTREMAASVLARLPQPKSSESDALASHLGAGWHFRRKQRLDPNHSDFTTLDNWLAFLQSEEGARNSGGAIERYAVPDQVDSTDFDEEVRQTAQIFRPLMERMAFNALPTTAPPVAALETATAEPSAVLHPLNDLLRQFLQQLAVARGGPFQKSEPLWQAIAKVKERLEQFPAVAKRPDLLVNISVGQGNWAAVPWMALLNAKITQTTQAGIYVVFLISADLTRIYLTLNQGTTNLVRELGQAEAQKQMIDVAQKARGKIADLATAGFTLDNEISLGSEGWLARNYEIGTIAHVEFAADSQVSDETLDKLLEAVLDAYDRAVDVSASAPLSPELPSKSISEPYTIDNALAELFLEQQQLERMLSVWKVKKNLILQGAPGVGKTFVARRLAYLLLEETDAARTESVQFHQSYSYEDFVQGYRPDGDGGFVLRDGVFHRFCEKARLSPRSKHVFIIDEINRGNLSKIFGELMLLVEHDKRGPGWATSLTYSEPGQPRFFVPENVFMLGMMNTADRSLSIVDYALRRRFSFVQLEPKFESPAFKDTLTSRGVPEAIVSLIVTRMTALNAAIAEDRANLGPGYRIGHSFFVPGENFEYDSDWYRRVVETELYPLLGEYWFDDPDQADSWLQQLLQDAP